MLFEYILMQGTSQRNLHIIVWLVAHLKWEKRRKLRHWEAADIYWIFTTCHMLIYYIWYFKNTFLSLWRAVKYCHTFCNIPVLIDILNWYFYKRAESKSRKVSYLFLLFYCEIIEHKSIYILLETQSFALCPIQLFYLRYLGLLCCYYLQPQPFIIFLFLFFFFKTCVNHWV